MALRQGHYRAETERMLDPGCDVVEDVGRDVHDRLALGPATSGDACDDRGKPPQTDTNSLDMVEDPLPREQACRYYSGGTTPRVTLAAGWPSASPPSRGIGSLGLHALDLAGGCCNPLWGPATVAVLSAMSSLLGGGRSRT